MYIEHYTSSVESNWSDNTDVVSLNLLFESGAADETSSRACSTGVDGSVLDDDLLSFHLQVLRRKETGFM